MNKYDLIARYTTIGSILFAVLFAPNIYAFEMTDMAGRKVQVPDSLDRIYPSAPPMSLLTYILAPQKISAMTVPLNSQFFSTKSGYLDKSLENIPVVGGWHGNSRGANMETLLAVKPQLVISWKSDFVMKDVEKTFSKLNIPVVFVQEDSVEDEPNAIRFVGKVVSNETKAEVLAKDADERLGYVKKIARTVAENKKPIVYYAEGIDGLATECADSFHYEPISFVGVKPAFECEQKQMVGMEKVSIEEVIKVNPDIIIAQESKFASAVYTDSRWAGIKAVKNKRVYLVPKDPVNFLDRPPSFMRILGVQWLSSVIHPTLFKKDIKKETISFYKDYLRRDLNKEQAINILKGAK